MKTFNKNRGVTLTELLVVMLIIGLLSSIAVPVYINRMENARIKMAQAESRQIAEAEEACVLLHGYYVPFQLLDDHAANNFNNNRAEEIDLEQTDEIYLINPLIRPEDQLNKQVRLGDQTVPRAREMVTHWQGPFMTFHRFYLGNFNDPNSPQYINDPVLFLDFPLDPWGNPYRFYSPLGLVGRSSNVDNFTNLQLAFSDGYLTQFDDRNFDRYAVVSYGRDGRTDTLLGINNDYRDDVVYLFGTGGVESSFGLRI